MTAYKNHTRVRTNITAVPKKNRMAEKYPGTNHTRTELIIRNRLKILLTYLRITHLALLKYSRLMSCMPHRVMKQRH